MSSSCVDAVASLFDAVAPGRFFLPGWEAVPAVAGRQPGQRPGGSPTSAPILVVQGTADEVVPSAAPPGSSAAQLCRSQYDSVDYGPCPGSGTPRRSTDAGTLISRWLQARFAGTSGVEFLRAVPGSASPTLHADRPRSAE